MSSRHDNDVLRKEISEHSVETGDQARMNLSLGRDEEESRDYKIDMSTARG